MGDSVIKNVVFDFGGVVVNYDPKAYVKKLFGDAPAARYALDTIFSGETVGILDLGASTREAVYAPILEKARADGFGEELAYVRDHWVEDMMDTKEDTVALIRDLKRAGYGVYYLTNMPADLWELFGARGLVSLFDGGVASFEVHVTKPDRRIYELLLETCPIAPSETIFFDDMAPNVAGAVAAGIRAELFTDAKAAARRLREAGVRLDS